jgi:hypothetical protein
MQALRVCPGSALAVAWVLGAQNRRRRAHGRFSAVALALVAVAALLGARAASAATIWTFDLPATALSSQSPPYPVVATLTLTQTLDGVQFVLDPNESSPGFLASSADSFVERIDYVYAGPALAAGSFRNDDGPIDGFSFESNPNNMDSGYEAEIFHIAVDFPSKNDPGRFEPDQTRIWTVLGATLAQFTDTFATANSKPTPISGVISVSSYDLPGVNPTPSNWVHGVPEPGTWVLVSMGLSALVVSRRGRGREVRATGVASSASGGEARDVGLSSPGF